MAEGTCIGVEPICIADGRRLLPGQTVRNVDPAHPENVALVDAGQLRIAAGIDITASTVPDVLGWVGDDRERAAVALAAEHARPEADRRSTLVDKLEQLVATNPDSPDEEATP